MSFYNNASLVFLPSGGAGKDTKAYSIKPTNGDGDFTFSRGSNLTATRVDSNGLIEKGRENLLLQSNSFDTTWVTSNASVTSGQSGYDGSTDAWLLENIAGSSAFVKQDKAVNGVQTASVYAKSGNVDYIYLRLGGSSSRGLFVNLSNGTIHSTFGTLIDYNVDSVGNGWYRIRVTYEGNHSNFRIYASESGGTSTSLGDNIYIQDAQLEQGLVPTEYIESGASTGLAGILEDSPRFDYSGGASCPSLLLEPSRTNVLSNSEYFEDSKLGSVTLTTNAITSPEGVQNASLVVCPSGRLGENVSLTSGTDYIVSVFAKQKGQTFNMRAADGTNPSVEFNLATQTTTDTNGAVGSMEDYGNGWYRCIMKFTASATGSFEIRYVLITDDDGVYAFGAQMEQGSYPTSYIPNHSGGSVTREEDTNTTANISSVIGQQEGTFFLDFEFLDGTTAENQNWIALESEDGQSRVLFYKSAATNNLRLLNSQDGSTFFNKSSLIAISPNTRYKVAVRYDSGDQGVAVNGSMSGSNGTSTYTRTSLLSRVKFNESNIEPSCRIHQCIVFDSGLTDSELETLTS